ncbi:MAG TPA: transglycosylase SLT domain-containing protein, partial [Pyrinomonadaceae bacterium]|nr:transglycosylase SLT domain-containing protein [Pyrinomonadaceae bacterium]
PAARQALALIGQAYLRSEQQAAARDVFNSLVMQLPNLSRPDDFALAGVRGLDLLDSGSAEAAPKSAPQLPESEHLRRALIYNFNRDFAGARLHYSAIVERYGQSASVPDALFQIGRSFFQERRYDEAITHFQRVFTQYPESPSARDALGFAGSAYGRLKRTDEALAAYRQLIERYPDAPNPERPFLNIIDSLREAGRDGEALDWVRQTRERFKGRDGAALALFSQARIHLSRGAWDAALADFNALRGEAELGGTRLPGGTTQTEVAFMRAYVLEKLGRTDDAINAYLAIPDGRDEYYGGRATARLRALAADARTRAGILARAEALRADAQRALASVQAEKARINAQSALRLTEDAVLIRELLDIARRAYAFLPAYNSIPNPRLLAVGRQDVINEGLRKDEATPTHLALAGELLFLGLYDEGAPELAAAEDAFGAGGAEERKSARGLEADGQVVASSRAKPQTTRPPRLSRDAAFTLAVYFKRGDVAHRAVSFAEPLWKAVPRDYLLELAPREMVELLYPAPYAAALLEHAPPRGVDPRFVLAIARQESRFLPSAKSASAARGLMQFIPSTAREIAAQLGRRAFSQDDLYDPRVSLLFGSQYLGNLFRQFPAMPHAVAAAYNGGEDNVARWVDRARSHEPDQYVLEIGFAQSKDYVYRVIANQRVYQSLYTEQLQRR